MYSVSRLSHPEYGAVIHIEPSETGTILTPFQAVQSARKEMRIWKEGSTKKVRILIDKRVMSPQQAEHWAHEEYQALPKCDRCAKVLGGDVHTHQLSRDHLFCSVGCSDADYMEEMEKVENEEDVEL